MAHFTDLLEIIFSYDNTSADFMKEVTTSLLLFDIFVFCCSSGDITVESVAQRIRANLHHNDNCFLFFFFHFWNIDALADYN